MQWRVKMQHDDADAMNDAKVEDTMVTGSPIYVIVLAAISALELFLSESVVEALNYVMEEYPSKGIPFSISLEYIGYTGYTGSHKTLHNWCFDKEVAWYSIM